MNTRRIDRGDIKQRHVLVLGGAGYLGSALVRRLLHERYTVTVYDAFLYDPGSLDGVEAGDFLSVVRGDVRDTGRLRRVMEGKDVVVNLAAIVGDAACDVDRHMAVSVNADAARDAYRIADECGVDRYVFASTCSVYGFADDLLDEESFLNPVSLYAQTKLTGELLLLSARLRRRTTLSVLRFATLFGWSYRPRFDLVVNTMTSHALTRRTVTVYGGNQWRPHLHVRDAVDAITRVVEAPARRVDGEVFNVGGNELNMTILELGRRICRRIPDCRLVRERDVIDPRNYLVDFSKVRRRLSFRPRWTIGDGVDGIRRRLEVGAAVDVSDPVYSNVACLKARRPLEEAPETAAVAADADRQAARRSPRTGSNA